MKRHFLILTLATLTSAGLLVAWAEPEPRGGSDTGCGVGQPIDWGNRYTEAVAALQEAALAHEPGAILRHAAEARRAAGNAGLHDTPSLDRFLASRRFHAASKTEHERATGLFCADDYESAAPILQALIELQPAGVGSRELMASIYWNLAIATLREDKPWEAVWILEQVRKWLPEDEESAELGRFARQFPQGARLAEMAAYTDRVDSLEFRRPGCPPAE